MFRNVFAMVCIFTSLSIYAAENDSSDSSSFDQNEKITQINLMTINSANLPYILSRFPNGKQRAEKLAQTIRDLKPQPDIVAFQELFTSESRAAIQRVLKGSYNCVFDNRLGRLLVGVNSGLAICSRFSISNESRYSFKNYRGDENFAKKGVLGVTVHIPDRDPVYVFTTHMHAGGSANRFRCIDVLRGADTSMSSDEVRFAEMHEARRFIVSYVIEKPKGPIIFMGDFNIDAYDSDESYPESLALFRGMVDLYDSARSESDSTTHTKKERIDHIWLWKKTETFLEAYSYISNAIGPDVSDHKTVLGVLKYND